MCCTPRADFVPCKRGITTAIHGMFSRKACGDLAVTPQSGKASALPLCWLSHSATWGLEGKPRRNPAVVRIITGIIGCRKGVSLTAALSWDNLPHQRGGCGMVQTAGPNR
jgi:hypothetical protein